VQSKGGRDIHIRKTSEFSGSLLNWMTAFFVDIDSSDRNFFVSGASKSLDDSAEDELESL
jgi:hypothetical protein